MERIKFYSEYDMTCRMSLTKIVELISDFYGSSNEENINRILEYHNIIKFYGVENFKSIMLVETEGKINDVIKVLRSRIGKFINNYKSGAFLKLYEDIDIEYIDDFFELIEMYSIYNHISEDDFKEFLQGNDIHYPMILQFKKTVNKFGETLRIDMLQDENGAKILLRKYIDNEGSGEKSIYLPPTLTEEDKEKILVNYIESDSPHINRLEMIVNFPSKSELKVKDRIKVKAKRRYEKEREKIFEGANVVKTKMGVAVKYPIDQEEAVIYRTDNMLRECSVSRRWIEENLDFSTLWNNFIYIFNFVDRQMRLNLVSKSSEITTFEGRSRNNSKHLYKNSSKFIQKDMMSTAQITSYIQELKSYQIRLEEMVEWFFKDYLPKEFGINGFIVRMPTSVSTDFEKCRAILPEIDRILKQYDLYLEEGEIDEELLQISSSHMFFKDCKSCNNKKYVYPVEKVFSTVAFLLFSSQSSIFYIPKLHNRYKNFYELLRWEKVKLEDFREYQVERINWLIKNKYIDEDRDGYLKFVNYYKVILLADLYFNEVISYWNYPSLLRGEIDILINEGMVVVDNKLFTKGEQDYFDYHLNKSKFSNSLDLRNSYLHGTQTNDDELHRMNYLIFLKLIVIIVIKINDDLYIRDFSE
ncbi:hypothetical protein AB3H50_26940 [Bacillus pacificus]|uniref:hypothetical protein n=1 Tax=Bacillus cereus group TaxID=86661 RepID=UPI001123E56C|nr:hypothetical protein [Bacillus tropicus]TNP14901.1 hypothetical protein FHY73_22150 [Bacillus tropicus]